MEDPPSGVEQPARIASKAAQNKMLKTNRTWLIIMDIPVLSRKL